MSLAFHMLSLNVYEKHNDVLIRSPLLVVRGAIRVKSIRSGEGRQSRAPYFLYAVLHVKKVLELERDVDR
jgi:hypothetical protein